jgi:hypothetical protein
MTQGGEARAPVLKVTDNETFPEGGRATQDVMTDQHSSASFCKSPVLARSSPSRVCTTGSTSHQYQPLQHASKRENIDRNAEVNTSAWLEAGFDQALTGEQGLLQSVTSLAAGDVPSPCAAVPRAKAAFLPTASRLRESIVATCWQDRFMKASCTGFGVLESANFSELDADAEAEFLRELDAEVARDECFQSAAVLKSSAAVHSQASALLRRVHVFTALVYTTATCGCGGRNKNNASCGCAGRTLSSI